MSSPRSTSRSKAKKARLALPPFRVVGAPSPARAANSEDYLRHGHSIADGDGYPPSALVAAGGLGDARPDADGTAQVRSGAEPRPPTIYEVVVTRAVDDATSVPHGQPVLHWFDGSLGPPRAVPFDFARGA